jgi:HlyD family type I secretion membrane fusion protein
MSQDIQTTAEHQVEIYSPPTRRIPLPAPTPLRREVRGTGWLGIGIIVAFFGIGGGWAATAPLAGAVIASGVVSPEGSRKTVQHLEGGIIREIRVKEGDKVAAGDTVVVLEDVSAQAEVGTLRTRLIALAASEARLQAERTGAAAVSFEHPVLANRTDPEIRSVIDQQVNQFTTRKENDDSRVAVLVQRIAQLQQQIVGAQRQLQSVRRQNELIREELAAVKELFEKGYERKPRMLELQREEAELLGDEGDLLSRIARSEEQIGETRLQIIGITTTRREEVDNELADTKAERIEIEQRIAESQDRLKRTTIVAPVDGIVLDLQFKTTGGVVRPGEAILDIVPVQDELIIDARLAPQDIDDVRTGLQAYVIFPAYPQRNLHRIDAKVSHVSADSFTEERTGQQFFTAKVRVNMEYLRAWDPEIEPSPGMPAEVYISTIERTVLDYLVQPLLQSVERTFREP